LGLGAVEGVERIRVQHHGGGHVQDVQRARAQRRGMPPRQLPGHIVHRRWNGSRLEDGIGHVGRRSFQRGPGLRRRDLAPEYSQFDGVCRFRLTERSQEERPVGLPQVLPRRSRMRIWRIQRSQNA